MSTPKHTPTPGPWFAVIDRCRGKHGVISQAAGGYGVAIVPENEANARLIAAAPNLLAACKAGGEYSDALIQFQAAGFRGKLVPPTDELERLFRRWHDLTHAAIALAEPPAS